MADWSDLENELALWQVAGDVPTLWWRDDDAVAVTPALEPLLDLAQRHDVPVHLAVIPLHLEACLPPHLRQVAQVYVMQHGYAHLNHQPKGTGASEFGDDRDLELQLQDLRDGWQRMQAANLPNLLPGFVPPWNRMSAEALAALPGIGYRFVSAYPGHTPAVQVPRLLRIDGHIDPIRWKHGRQFRGTAKTLDLVIQHLADRRLGRADVNEPTCFLTHHLETVPEIWDFADQLFARTAGAAKWIPVGTLLEDR